MHYPSTCFEMPAGAASLDRLQQEVLEAMQWLASAPDRAFVRQYGEFVQQVEKIFRIEDMWMEELEYSFALCHREQHARVLSALHHVHARVMGGDIACGRDVAERLLPQWFALHVDTLHAPLGIAIAHVDVSDHIAEPEKRKPAISLGD